MNPQAEPQILLEQLSFPTYIVYAIERDLDIAKVEEFLRSFIRSSFVSTKNTEESLSFIKEQPGGATGLERLTDPNYWIVVTRFRLNIHPMQLNWKMIADMIGRNCQVEWIGFGVDQRSVG
jgi:hypothetical protein